MIFEARVIRRYAQNASPIAERFRIAREVRLRDALSSDANFTRAKFVYIRKSARHRDPSKKF